MTKTTVRALSAVIALQLGIAALGILTAEDRGGSPLGTTQGPAGRQQATTMPTVAGGTSAPLAPTDPTTPGAASQESASNSPVGGAPPAAGQPPRPGTYRFRSRTEGRSAFGSSTTIHSGEQEASYRYERVAASSAEVRMRKHNVDGSPKDDEVEFAGYEEHAWRSGSALLLSETSTTRRSGREPEERRTDCDWSPDIPLYEFPLRAGTEWSWESSCTSPTDVGESTRTRTGKARVTGTREHTVGGRATLTWVIEREEVQIIRNQGTFPGPDGPKDQELTSRIESRTTDLFAAAAGLDVRSEGTYKFENEGFDEDTGSSSDGTAETDLVSLDPA